MRAPHQSKPNAEPIRPRVFIGSSGEGLEVARAVQSALYYEAEPIMWSQGVFGLSGGTLETLVAEADAFDFAVFVLTPDDLVRKRGKRRNSPRDNVLFELGLFMGRLGRDRTFFVTCRSDDLELPTDLAGVTAASYLAPSEPRYLHAALSAASTPILSAVRRLGVRSAREQSPRKSDREFDDLRSQIAEMRIALSAFSAYAQSAPERPTERALARTTDARVPRDLAFLEGTWKSEPIGSMAWCKVLNGRPKFLYSYGGEGYPTGEYYGFKRTGNALVGRFKWFGESGIDGRAWFEIVDDTFLRGGWWMRHDVPRRLVRKLPHVPGMIPSEWRKRTSAVPPDLEQYFR